MRPRPAAVAACVLGLLFVGAVAGPLVGCGGSSAQPEVAEDVAPASPVSLDGVRPARAISSTDARRLVAAGAVLLDVRSKTEFALRHIDGATNIPLPELDARASELQADLPVIVYCVSGHRSANAGRILRAKGFTYVFDLGSMVSY